MKSLSKTVNIYFESRMAKIFLLGTISGFPWVLIGSALSLWLKEEGLSRTTIGWAGLIFGVYAINFLWSPLVDRLKVPVLTRVLGPRRPWIILPQILILVSLLVWSLLDPVKHLWIIVGVGLVIAIASATQDIAIDALRIELIDPTESLSMAAGAAVSVIGWWTGYKVGGMLTLFIAESLQNLGVPNYWQYSFILLCLIVIASNCGLCFVYERKLGKDASLTKTQSSSQLISFLHWSLVSSIKPLTSFFTKNGYTIAIAILSFVFLFKIGESFLGRMSIIFYSEIGFSKSDIALYSKGVGWITTVCFTLIGGIFAIRLGILKALFISGIAMASTNLFFSLLAWVEKSEVLFAMAVLLDDLATAFATVTFVAFISLLVDRKFTATQYALLASIGTAGRTLLASSSGALVDLLNGNWGVFFILTAVLVIPSLIILGYLWRKLNI